MEFQPTPATQLDTHAWKNGADLIIVGAYGHTRLREWALGGVTRDLSARDLTLFLPEPLRRSLGNARGPDQRLAFSNEQDHHR